MEIKKADSKGRVTGLERGRYYRIDRLDTGVVVFHPIGLKEDYESTAGNSSKIHIEGEVVDNLFLSQGRPANEGVPKHGLN